MRKILFFSATLVTMVFMALSVNSCVKKAKNTLNDVVNSLFPLSGSSWSRTLIFDNTTEYGTQTIVFSSENVTITTKVTVLVDGNEIGTETTSATYTYNSSKKTGEIKATGQNGEPISIPFAVSGNNLYYDGTTAADAEATFIKK